MVPYLSPAPRRRVALLIGCVTFFSFLYFYDGGGWNQNSRFDLLRAIVERHTLQIDAYHDNTQDQAHFAGHYYSDKAPGVVFLAVPVAEIAQPVLRATGVAPQSAPVEFAMSYLVSAFSIALPTALAAVCLFFLGLRFGSSVGGAAFGALAMCLATPIWAYASLFWAHALVGACLLFAFAAALKVGDSTTVRSQFLWALVVGLAAGWATVTEYPAAPASAILAIFALSRIWPRSSAVRWRVAVGVGLGAMACAVVLFGYLYAAFGSLRPSYSYYDPNSFSFMQQQGYMGLTYPHPDRLLKLLFGASRGLFFASPVLFAALFGLWWLWKEKTHRTSAVVAIAIPAYYFLFNASFYWWKAGLTFGPRYAGASIPFFCIGLAVAWRRATSAWKWGLSALAALSAFIALIVISTTSELSMQNSNPIFHNSWPAFRSGKLALNHDSMLTASEAVSGHFGAFNLGQLMGLHGLASLLPLLVVWAIAFVLLWRIISVASQARVAIAARSASLNQD